MDRGEREVRETILTARARTGEALAVVAFGDGSYGITREGVAVEELHWQDGQMKECIEALVRLAGLDGNP